MRATIYTILAIGLLGAAIYVRRGLGPGCIYSHAGKARAQISMFKTALNAYQINCGRYPSGPDRLADLVRKPPGEANWQGPYLVDDAIPKDPWGYDYIYQCPGRHNTNSFDLMSMGPDGHRGTEDDITNWQIRK